MGEWFQAMFHFRYFRTRGVYANQEAFVRVLKNAMDNEIGRLMLNYCYRVVENWDELPQFRKHLTVTELMVSAGISVHGPGGDKWMWVSRGVPGRFIKPSRAAGFGYKPALMFPGPKYWPHTSPGWRFGGAGRFQGKPRFSKGHWWPGIKPRHFEAYVREQSRSEFRRLMENAARRAVRAAQREGD